MILASLNADGQSVILKCASFRDWILPEVQLMKCRTYTVGHNLPTKSFELRRQEGQRKSLFGSYLVCKKSRIREYEYRGHSYTHWKIAQCHVTLRNLSSDLDMKVFAGILRRLPSMFALNVLSVLSMLSLVSQYNGKVSTPLLHTWIVFVISLKG